MNDTIQFTCPNCHHQMRLPASASGKQGKCAGCEQVVLVNPTKNDDRTLKTPSPTQLAIRRDGNKVVLPLNSELPLKCVVTGKDVEGLHQRTIVYSRSVPQIIYLLMIFAPLALYDPEISKENTKPPVVKTRQVSEAEDIKFGLAISSFFLGLIGLGVSFSRYQKVKIHVGIVREYRKTQLTVECVSAFFLIAGGGLAAGIREGFNDEMIAIASIIAGSSCGLLLFLVVLKLFLGRPRLRVTLLNGICVVFKGAGESFLENLEELSDSERKAWLN